MKSSSLALVIAIGVCLLLPAVDAFACTCIASVEDLSPCHSASKADLVFSGTVIGLTPGSVGSPMVATRARIEVDQWFKGQGAPIVEIRTVAATSMCGFHFVEGETYLVFAELAKGIGWTSGCDPTVHIKKAQRHLKYLSRPTRRTSTRLDGVWDTVSRKPVSGAVVVKGPSTMTLRTDVRGAFEADDLEPGNYKVTFVPDDENLTAPQPQTMVVEKGRCEVLLARSCEKKKGRATDCQPAPVRWLSHPAVPRP